MLRRLLVIGLLLSLSCNFAVKHPAATAGIVAGGVALTTCRLASDDNVTCLGAGGAVGVGLALVAAFALWLGTEDEPEPATEAPPPQVDWSQIPDTTPAQPTQAPPPPPDAGVASPPPDAAPASAPAVDAGAPDAAP